MIHNETSKTLPIGIAAKDLRSSRLRLSGGMLSVSAPGADVPFPDHSPRSGPTEADAAGTSPLQDRDVTRPWRPGADPPRSGAATHRQNGPGRPGGSP